MSISLNTNGCIMEKSDFELNNIQMVIDFSFSSSCFLIHFDEKSRFFKLIEYS